MAQPSDDRPGLRERKKARTRRAIRDHAMRLFTEQGYAATTVEQIAEAAEVSPSTFFRYFPTKEEVVLADDIDPVAFESFQNQPPEMTPLEALRATLTDVFGNLSEEDWELERHRQVLIASVPELRAAVLLRLSESVAVFAEQVAKRVGRDPADFEVRNFAGVVLGTALTGFSEALEQPMKTYIETMDRALEHLQQGLPL
ncbi:TetR family transcriptional regulator [Labedaea rhizosphaerae]|uniref:TetR family transcriptional regulator n=1 Tax=Labedaea rhizosphaerae TaxID=598644 RepID=A0A4R6SNS3_LABRH|nr:TetR family transcriptional regulator [Labedaea rhizosphaerae]TDQ04833.1 TetR family transcriptional regulator [Labedaea rhizosphaerae]